MNQVSRRAFAAEIAQQLLLHPRARIREVYLFGSVAEGSHHEDSDIDLIVVCDEERWRAFKLRYTGHKAELGDRFTALHQISIACEVLSIAYNDPVYELLTGAKVHVDLVVLPEYWKFRNDLGAIGVRPELFAPVLRFDPFNNSFH